MQTNFQSDLSRARAVEGQADLPDRNSAPIELSLADLQQVSGGKAPNGTWTSDAAAEAPNGSW